MKTDLGLVRSLQIVFSIIYSTYRYNKQNNYHILIHCEKHTGAVREGKAKATLQYVMLCNERRIKVAHYILTKA